MTFNVISYELPKHDFFFNVAEMGFHTTDNNHVLFSGSQLLYLYSYQFEDFVTTSPGHSYTLFPLCQLCSVTDSRDGCGFA